MVTITRTLTVLVHPAEEGGYWGEVLELPGCVSQGETRDELQRNMREAIEAVLENEEANFQVESSPGEFRVISQVLAEETNMPIGGTGTWTEAAASRSVA